VRSQCGRALVSLCCSGAEGRGPTSPAVRGAPLIARSCRRGQGDQCGDGASGYVGERTGVWLPEMLSQGAGELGSRDGDDQAGDQTKHADGPATASPGVKGVVQLRGMRAGPPARWVVAAAPSRPSARGQHFPICVAGRAAAIDEHQPGGPPPACAPCPLHQLMIADSVPLRDSFFFGGHREPPDPHRRLSSPGRTCRWSREAPR
jgi:hypothetical protein